jgi:hypothetical protein
VKGGYAVDIKRASLRIEQAYEKRLHNPSPSGAIFVLKSLGWSEKAEDKNPIKTSKTLKVKIIQTESKPVSDEKAVII